MTKYKAISKTNSPHGEVFHIIDDENNKDYIDYLRELALRCDPKHGDKLYPLEVLGSYYIMHNDGPLSWNFSLGNPEYFADIKITNWLRDNGDYRFKNRLERCLNQNDSIREIFLLRLNYAYLLEEGKDSISIHRNKTRNLEGYKSIDEIGNVYGNEDSAIDLIKDSQKLDDYANSFYDSIEEIHSCNTGTNINLRNIIHTMLLKYGYDISDNLDEVYRKLRDNNKRYLEEGLIARIGYLAFEAEFKGNGPFNQISFSDS